MTLKITPIRTHWEAEEAWTVIEFLDELRDLLWQTYGDQITDMLREAAVPQLKNTDQGELEFDDEISF